MMKISFIIQGRRKKKKRGGKESNNYFNSMCVCVKEFVVMGVLGLESGKKKSGKRVKKKKESFYIESVQRSIYMGNTCDGDHDGSHLINISYVFWK
eukprot:UN10886